MSGVGMTCRECGATGAFWDSRFALTSDGPICLACLEPQLLRCGICGQSIYAYETYISVTDGTWRHTRCAKGV